MWKEKNRKEKTVERYIDKATRKIGEKNRDKYSASENGWEKRAKKRRDETNANLNTFKANVLICLFFINEILEQILFLDPYVSNTILL